MAAHMYITAVLPFTASIQLLREAAVRLSGRACGVEERLGPVTEREQRRGRRRVRRRWGVEKEEEEEDERREGGREIICLFPSV